MTTLSSALILILTVVQGASSVADNNVWTNLDSEVSSSLRGLCVVSHKVVWASGSESTVIRTIDGGNSWQTVSVKRAPKLDFRDICAFDKDRAIVIAAGQPAHFYRTEDGGKSWQLCFEHADKKSFFDAVSFRPGSSYGMAMSDPIDGRILLAETTDWGHNWIQLPDHRRPEALEGEAGFAASGTNMRMVGRRILIALGGAPKGTQEKESRIVFTEDRADSWRSMIVPIPRSESSGIFSMDFLDRKNGVVVGGDYLKPDQATGNVAFTKDGGANWRVPEGRPPSGYRSGVAYCKRGMSRTKLGAAAKGDAGKDSVIVVCVGPNGTDASVDMGNNWKTISEQGFHAIAFTRDGRVGFATGADGRVARTTPRAIKSKIEVE